MAQNPSSKPKQNNPVEKSENLSEDSIKEFLSVQKQKVQNEAKDLHIREKELDHSARLSEQSLKLQAEHLKSRPGEARKFFWTIGIIGGGILVIVLSFLGICLYLGKEDFANTFWTGLTYVVTTLFGYLVGRKSKGNNNNSNRSQDAEVIDN